MNLYKKKVWKRNSYITDGEYQEALTKFYNNDSNYTSHIYSNSDSTYRPRVKQFNESFAKTILLDEETYEHFEKAEWYIITSYGRIINTYGKKLVCPMLTTKSLFLHFNYKAEDVHHLVPNFDPIAIADKHIEENWCLRIAGKPLIDKYGSREIGTSYLTSS